MAVAISPRPSVPPPQVCGVVNVPAGTPVSLLSLIQKDIDENCPGTSVELRLEAHPSCMAPIWFGAASPIGGKLSVMTAAYSLSPCEVRIYRSTFPGGSTPIGVLQVFSEVAAKLKVEIHE